MPVLRRLGNGPSDAARIVALGCGGAGCNILRRLRPAQTVVSVAVNDAPIPAMAGIARRVLVDRGPLRALAEADPAVAADTAAPIDKALAAVIERGDLAVLFAGLGGDTGGWAAVIAARVARRSGMATIAFVATPFGSEGVLRRTLAKEQAGALSLAADAVVAFENDGLLRMAPALPLARAFGALAAIMVRPSEELARVARVDDLAALREAWKAADTWRYGAGEGRDRHASYLAVEEAVASPWFHRRFEDATAALAIVTASPEAAPDEAVRELRKRLPEAFLLYGAIPEPSLERRVRVSITAGWS